MNGDVSPKAQRFRPFVDRIGAMARTHKIPVVIVLGPEWPEHWGKPALVSVMPPSNDVSTA